MPLAVIMLAGLALRSVGLNAQPLWWDEGYSVWFATHPLGQMVALTALDIHPPLYYALLHVWTEAFGTAPVALRLFSVAAGTLSIPIIYLAGRRLIGDRGAWLAAVLMAINPLAVYYSQEIRMYGLEATLAAGILAASWPVFGRDVVPGPRRLAACALLTAAALYTEYYAVFLPIGLALYALWLWLSRRRRPAWLGRWLAAQAAAALLYLPWVVYATPSLVPYVSQKVAADADQPLGFLPYVGRHLAAFIAGHLEGPLAPWWPAALVMLVPVALGLYMGRRRERPSARPLSPIGNEGQGARPAQAAAALVASPAPARQPGAIPMLVTVLAVALTLGYAISRRYPFFPPHGERLLLLALPVLVLLWASALDRLWQEARWAGLACIGLAGAVAAASLLGFYTIPRYPDDDYRPLLARVVEQGRPGDTLFCVYPWQVGYWRSYAPQSGYTRNDETGPQAVLSPSPGWNPEVAAALNAALERGHLWFPEHLSNGAILETRVEAYLRGRHASEFANQWYGTGTRLSAWSAVDAASPLQGAGHGPVRFTLGALGVPELILAGVEAPVKPIGAANDVAPLVLHWQAAANPPALTASVRLVDDLSQIWAQHDYELQGGAQAAPGQAGWEATDESGLLVPAGTPPGRYTVQIAVSRKGETRTLEALAGAERGAAASLYELTVAPAGRTLTPDRLPVARRQQTPLGDGLIYLGYSAGSGPEAPGSLLRVNLFWQAAATPAHDYTAFLQVIDGSGKVVAGWEAPPGAAYPTTRWSTGTLMRTQAALRLPAALADGPYRLIAGLFRSDNRQRLSAAGGADNVALGTVTVRGRTHDFTPPRPSQPADAAFGGTARLVGYDLASTATAPGGSLAITLYWQALKTPEHAYTVFVHLVSDMGTLHGAGDGEPGAGAAPTTGWVPGEYLTDPHTLAVDPGSAPGRYQVAIGLYDPGTGQRLALPDGSDQLILGIPVDVR